MIQWREIDQTGVAAAFAGVERGLDRIATRAKELAPVRKIFGQFQKPYRTTLKTIGEIESDRALRKQLGLGPENAYINPPLKVERRAPQNLGKRRLEPRLDPYTGRRRHPPFVQPNAGRSLDRRGRYEYRTLRSHHDDSLGGRLRSEIYATSAKIDGRIISGKVISPTPYAKYQEMGTRHNPAHPYLRPAGYESREAIRADIGRSVVVATRPLFRGRLEVVVHTRAR